MSMRLGLPAKKGATDASDTRWDFRNLVVCNKDGTPRGGITSPVGVSLLSATGTMNVAVAAFSGIAVRDSGVVLLANDGTTNVLLDPPPASQSRLDVVYAKQNDSSSTVASPDANDAAAFGVLKGAAAAFPVRNPAGLPQGALELGTVLVPSTATTTSSSGVVITQTAAFTAAPGGLVPFRTVADLLTWTTAAPLQKASVFADSTVSNNGEHYWDTANSRWVRVGGVELLASASTATVNAAAGGGLVTVGTLSLTLAVARRVRVRFSGYAQPGAASTNVAGNLAGIRTDAGTAVGLTKRVANLNASGNSAVYAQQEAELIIPAGTHTIDLQASTDSASGTSYFWNNPQLEVWAL